MRKLLTLDGRKSSNSWRQTVYRGVAYDTDQKKTEDRVYKRPELVYRGVAHNGVRTTETKQPTGFTGKLIYRGLRLA